MSVTIIHVIRQQAVQPKPQELLEYIVELLGIGQEDALINMAARGLEYRLIRLARIERMLERMIELNLKCDNCTVDMLYDYSMQYHGIKRMLIRMGVLDKDTTYDLDDLGIIHAGVFS